MAPAKIGLIGLAVMGENLALNIAEKGFPIAVFNRTVSRVEDFVRRHPEAALVPCRSVADLVAAIEPPRRIILLVKAGPPVDEQLALLRPHLSPGDIVVDAGNSWFLDTERRDREYAAAGLRFVGMGVSGGEEGARHGPSIMPGGSREAYEALSPVLTRIAAQVDDGPCVTHVGPGGAGHYVKMVHNGIEYADMQLIAEAYAVLRHLGGLDAPALHRVFAEWNEGELQSYLVEITSHIFARVDDETGRPLVELVLDAAGQKGTGRWTIQNALELGAPVPTITAAVEGRMLSALKEERLAAAPRLPGPPPVPSPGAPQLVEQVRAALYAAKICCYAQGMALLRIAGEAYQYQLNLAELARIWKGGCIIRARLLDRISQAYRRDPELANLMLDEEFRAAILTRQAAWREVVGLAVKAGIPVPGFASALAYFDSYRSAELPANLIQAQRDYFGAHTYQRVDRPGVFHTEWGAAR
jgi:6-phosphogluconate dehydrogenase